MFSFDKMMKYVIVFAGKLVEYNEPMNLMKREGSFLGQLVMEYWSHSQSAESY